MKVYQIEYLYYNSDYTSYYCWRAKGTKDDRGPSMSSEPVGTAFRTTSARLRRAAHIGATAAAMSLATLGLANAQTAVAVNSPPSSGATQALPPITKDQCKIIVGFTLIALREEGKNLITAETREGLKKFFVTKPGVMDCSGPREIPWVTGDDFDFIMAMADKSTDSLKVDVRTVLGMKPALRPSAGSAPNGRRGELNRAPRG